MSFKKDLINHIEEIADMMEFKGENRNRITTYKSAANAVRQYEGDIEEKIAGKSVTDLRGIGDKMANLIYEFSESGSSRTYDDIKDDVSDGVLEILRLRGLGAKKVKLLHDELGINNLEELEQACSEDKVAGLKGFGAKTQEKILKELERIKEAAGKVHLHRAYKAGSKLLDQLNGFDSVKKAGFTGELRRVREVITKIEMILHVSSKTEFENELGNSHEFKELDGDSSHYVYHVKDVVLTTTKLYVVEDESEYDKLLLKTTGADDFLSGIKITSEKDIDAAPEMREEEYNDAPGKLRVPSNLEQSQFKGLIHFHTTASDGNNSLAEMAQAAHENGYEYMVVCDHSKSAFYAGGLDEKRIRKQHDEIADYNRGGKLMVYKGIESDILKDGSLDYDEDVLAEFDFIVASIHSIFTLSEDEMTKRIITAVENPYTDLIAHPTGRLLLTRDPYAVDIRKVIDACAANNVAIEINSNPHRLDLDWRHYYYAREKGCRFAINPDAHSTEEIGYTKYGIMMARKGGIQADDVINTLQRSKFEEYINRKVNRYKN